MSQFAPVPTLIEIDDVQSARASAGEVRLRLSGRWVGAEPPSATEEPLLVVQVEGRRHRFAPERPDPRAERDPEPGRWSASFALPSWAEPRRVGQAAVWIGEIVIPIPLAGTGPGWASASPPALASAVPADAPRDREPGAPPASEVDPPPAAEPAPAPPAESVPPPASVPGPPAWEPDPRVLPRSSPPALANIGGETPRSGPLADLLLKETVAALHSELESRAGEAAQLRTALSGAHSELEARSQTQGELERTLGELGAELRRLMEAVEGQRAELDRSQADAEQERAGLEERLAAASAERDQLATELTGLREQLMAAEARFHHRTAESAGLREELASAQVSREAARSESAGLRAELDRLGTELAVTRERVDSEAGDLGQANRLLADARALAEQLRAGSPDR